MFIDFLAYLVQPLNKVYQRSYHDETRRYSMKTYVSDNQIRLVGRVWEIRRYLTLARQRAHTDMKLQEYLTELTGYSAQSGLTQR
ncbi:Z-ring formation inhibitor MciZ [Paenibacillus xerothermodurans]|uniref:Z-ring formation inhibitor MciZ n=2 Tax=Paenibacillus xerothermodurans TaxID=1977292 RepID=A0A2W1P2R5_PAEXE|nr:Z-ring formation inhibitor MciZ [Paenibacillus xerothermodurans]